MMDLLVQVASANRLKPGEHILSVISEQRGRAIEFLSSQSVGSLGVSRVFLINKALQKKQRENEVQKQRDASTFQVSMLRDFLWLMYVAGNFHSVTTKIGFPIEKVYTVYQTTAVKYLFSFSF